MDLQGRDLLLLWRLVHALAVLLEAAVHAPDAARMARALLLVVVALRQHADASVRRAVLFALGRVLLVLSAGELLGALAAETGVLCEWLQAAAAADPDRDCRGSAAALLRHPAFAWGP